MVVIRSIHPRDERRGRANDPNVDGSARTILGQADPGKDFGL